jgi:hypothetical protein
LNLKRRSRLLRRKDWRRNRFRRKDKLSLRDCKLRRLHRNVRLNQRNKSSWLLKLSKRLSKLLPERLLLRPISLDLREEMNFKELKLKHNLSS